MSSGLPPSVTAWLASWPWWVSALVALIALLGLGVVALVALSGLAPHEPPDQSTLDQLDDRMPPEVAARVRANVLAAVDRHDRGVR